jgi:hypothetical protein
MINHKPRSCRRQSLQIEALENRGLLSTLAPTGAIPAEVHTLPHLVPLKGTFEGTAQVAVQSVTADFIVLSVEITGSGNFSHLGKFTFQSHQIDTINRHTGVSIVTEGRGLLTAANGDQLLFNYGGTGLPNGIGFKNTFDFTISGGTGRFADATGHGVIVATDVPGANFPFVADADGFVSTVGSN